MAETTLTEQHDTSLTTDAAASTIAAAIAPALPAAAPIPCGDCLGSGGWFRYEPALEPAPGLLYLSCLQCRGSGRTAARRA